jgi:tRNA pseudouridine38-40 synthase
MTDNTAVPMHLTQPEESDKAMATIRVALLVEYCGRNFHGSQFQPHRATVQSALQDALRHLNIRASAVSFAGRTDAGVNARGQVAHFDTTPVALANVSRLDAALNAILPESVAVRAVQLSTGSHFNSRRDTECKWYRYTIHNAHNRSVWADRMASTQHHAPLDAARMHQAAQWLLGTHDFRSFKDSATPIVNDICAIRVAQVVRDGDFINFDVAADRFLYKMVRNIAAQLMLIGNMERPLPPESILDVMEARDRRLVAQTARPEGLTMMAIQYKSPFNFFAQDLYVRQLDKMLNPTKMESLPHENLFRKAS